MLSVSKLAGLKTALGSVEVAVTSLDCSWTLPKTTVPGLEFSATGLDHTVWICTPNNLIFTQFILNLQIESSFPSPCLSLAEKSPCYSQTQTWLRSFSLMRCKNSNSGNEFLIFWDLGITFLSHCRISAVTTSVTQQRNYTVCKSGTSYSQNPSNSPIHWVISEETSPIFGSVPFLLRTALKRRLGSQGGIQLHLLFSETPTCSESHHLTWGAYLRDQRGGFLPGSLELAEVSLPSLNEHTGNLTPHLVASVKCRTVGIFPVKVNCEVHSTSEKVLRAFNSLKLLLETHDGQKHSRHLYALFLAVKASCFTA